MGHSVKSSLLKAKGRSQEYTGQFKVLESG